jgi:hypothetical protein
MYGRDGRRLGGGRPHSRLREWDPGTPALTLVRPYRDVGCRIFNAGGVIDPAPPEVWIKNKKSLRSRRLSGKTPGGPWVIFFTAEAQSLRRQGFVGRGTRREIIVNVNPPA